MLGSQRLREAELAFLNAPFEEGGWLLAIEQLASLTGSRLAQLCTAGSPALQQFNLFSDDCQDRHGHLNNPLLYGPENWRINTTTRPRTIQHDVHYAAYRARFPGTFYDDAVSDLDLPFGCQSALWLDDNGLIGLALLRSSRDGACTAETIACFRQLARQAHRALRVQLALGEEAAELMVSGTAGRREATILLDRFANLLAMTEAAEQLFDLPGGPALAGHRLRLPHPGEDKALGAAFARLLSADRIDGPMIHETVIGRCPSFPRGRWRLVVVHLHDCSLDLSFQPQLALTLTPLVA